MTFGQTRDLHFLEFLITNQNSDGGWGYHPASPSAVEATATVLLALNSMHQASLTAEACARARIWLVQGQRAEGFLALLSRPTAGLLGDLHSLSRLAPSRRGAECRGAWAPLAA